MARSLVLTLLLLGNLAQAAYAQIFTLPINPFHGYEPRLSLAAYAAVWDTPRPIGTNLRIQTSRNEVITERLFVTPESAGAALLLEGSYRLSRHWNLGFWYNPTRGDSLRGKILLLLPGGFIVKDLVLRRDADLSDLHVSYSGPYGLSLQLGYYREQGKVRSLSVTDLPLPAKYTLVSWNLWLTEQRNVPTGRFLTTPFLSVGYHPSSDLHHAASVQLGAAITFKRLSLSGSVWFFDIAPHKTPNRVIGGTSVSGTERTAIRVTGGLAYRL